ncbi:hypothetical protein, partial [Nocardia sp. NPDC049149]|uniref:hypothetical protein n=1 Tax=Nocardia sp. NPDC049149 TaxID=3364315 RepID=UPI003717F16A
MRAAEPALHHVRLANRGWDITTADVERTFFDHPLIINGHCHCGQPQSSQRADHPPTPTALAHCRRVHGTIIDLQRKPRPHRLAQVRAQPADPPTTTRLSTG